MHISRKIISYSIVIILLCFKESDCDIALDPTENGLSISIHNDAGQVTLEGLLGVGIDFGNVNCQMEFRDCQVDDTLSFKVTDIDGGHRITWLAEDVSHQLVDKYNLDMGGTYWFGGPQRYLQNPLEKLVLDGNDPYVIKKADNFAVAERYWLNSKGTFIFIDDRVPLFIDQNTRENGSFFLIAKSENPYINRNRTILQYDIITMVDSKQAHLYAVNNYLGKPTGYPSERMIRKPIWTTWPKYKQSVDQEKVEEFVKEIIEHEFLGGQIEIDEKWEVCFGSHVFDTVKFPDAPGLIASIKDRGFQTALWNSPFVNNDCQNYSTEGLENGYFVKDPDGNTRAIWWESDDAHQVDFTNPQAAEWFASKIRALVEETGLDGFKFDAGETDYAIPPHQFDHIDDQELVPNIFTQKYVETCVPFGGSIEVRSAWRTQKHPVFIRMIDKDSVWGVDDGLYTLVTTLIQMNMVGYTLVLPDMVGGNGYRQQPNAELIVRWTQANAFMPSIQLGFLPWDYPSDEFDTVEIVRKFVNLHEEYSDDIIKAMKDCIENGNPVNPPIWWIDPTDSYAFSIADEFLLGENILVAPILEEAAKQRSVYLPKGKWRDANNNDIIYTGPLNITNYIADIDILPYFIKLE
ncbi:myogenesis-regulating glycosidase-like [Diorhabda sublineata]|uniref:myogenesis-regulating glycosidase-like n=1 Tax=Diorhabda sublineata TaxID=1163346 RepID=UPI0024E09C3D|nr:myogenesis-regulating glycosidase-like [Diorhabda sublineata]